MSSRGEHNRVPVGFGGTGPGPAGSKIFGTGSKIFGPGPGTGRDRFQNRVPGPTSSAEASRYINKKLNCL